MATLILTAVGTAVGGPIGGMIGAIVGQSVNQAIFAPKARHGPRLGDLSVQTSSYGTAIPKIFGTMRVAGTVIWSTDLIEHRSTSGGGKGKPKTVSYSYSASFAVALSGRRILEVRRIWADGKLLRGAAGDFKSQCRFRLYLGDEDQGPDPMIASAEGIGQTLAHRGLAYAMFQDLQLEDYGNRIPSLTFEVVAERGPVLIGAIAEELSAGAVETGATPSLGGYAASGDSVRSALEALGEVVPLSLVDEGAALRLTAKATAPINILAREESGRREIVRRGTAGLPGEVSIAYYDAGRDYQTGLQRAVHLPGAAAQRSDRRALPAVLSANEAKAMAELRLAALRAGQNRAKLQLAWRRIGIRPGAHVRIEGQAGLWKVERWALRPMLLTLDLVRVAQAPLLSLTDASAGRPVREPDRLHGRTHLRFYDLPIALDGAGDKVSLLAMAAGEEAGWRRAALMTSYDGGARWQSAGPTAGPAVLGSVEGVLPSASSALIDMQNKVVVRLLNDGMWLESRSDQAVAGGSNLALLGQELIQFGEVEALGDRRFRLSRLLRGRRGTEWASAVHEAGEDFALIEESSIVAVEPAIGSLGGEARLMASGLGDDEPALAAIPILGETLRPPSPVHLHARETADNALHIEWVRRSRSGWGWQSGSATPLGEESERYLLILSSAGAERRIELDAASYVYAGSDRAADGLGAPMTISVSQIGSFATSRPISILFG